MYSDEGVAEAREYMHLGCFLVCNRRTGFPLPLDVLLQLPAADTGEDTLAHHFLWCCYHKGRWSSTQAHARLLAVSWACCEQQTLPKLSFFFFKPIGRPFLHRKHFWDGCGSAGRVVAFQLEGWSLYPQCIRRLKDCLARSCIPDMFIRVWGKDTRYCLYIAYLQGDGGRNQC